jgi:hypothetical protein
MSLQKLTKLEQKTKELLALEIITREDINVLTEEQIDHFQKATMEILNNSKGEELDQLRDKIDPILSQHTKNDIWENNHRKIIQETSNFINEYGRMPLKIDLAQRVGLSRQTLNKHLKEYKNHSLYKDHFESFSLMTEKLMSKMFQFALRGDVKAARLYFDILSRNEAGNYIKNQKNYIQVNNLIISEENLKALSQDQLEKIEEILVGQKKLCI